MDFNKNTTRRNEINVIRRVIFSSTEFSRTSTDCRQAFFDRALAAGKHRRIAQRERTRLGFAQFLHEIKKICRFFSFRKATTNS